MSVLRGVLPMKKSVEIGLSSICFTVGSTPGQSSGAGMKGQNDINKSNGFIAGTDPQFNNARRVWRKRPARSHRSYNRSFKELAPTAEASRPPVAQRSECVAKPSRLWAYRAKGLAPDSRANLSRCRGYGARDPRRKFDVVGTVTIVSRAIPFIHHTSSA
jgi:hypothetical protein